MAQVNRVIEHQRFGLSKHAHSVRTVETARIHARIEDQQGHCGNNFAWNSPEPRDEVHWSADEPESLAIPISGWLVASWCWRSRCLDRSKSGPKRPASGVKRSRSSVGSAGTPARDVSFFPCSRLRA